MVFEMEKYKPVSAVDWLNHLIAENQKNYFDKTPDQIVLDFFKRTKEFPFLNEWNEFFMRAYFKDMRADIAPAFVGLIRHTAGAEAKPNEYLWTVALAAEGLLSAYSVLTPFRIRFEQYLKTPKDRSPDFLGDFYHACKGGKAVSEAIQAAASEEFSPQLKNFWRPEDLEVLRRIRNGLAATWKAADFEYKGRDIEELLNFCLTVRMQMVEFNARMIYSSGSQWIEILRIFLRRTLPSSSPEFLSLGNDIPNNEKTAREAGKALVKLADKFYGWPAPRLPNDWLNCGVRGLDMPQYPKLYKSKEKERKIS